MAVRRSVISWNSDDLIYYLKSYHAATQTKETILWSLNVNRKKLYKKKEEEEIKSIEAENSMKTEYMPFSSTKKETLANKCIIKIWKI